MNIKALRAFRAILSTGSLAAAADSISLSQSAASRLLSGLEGELRFSLFNRTGRKLVPTPEGLSFYREAGRIIDGLDQIPKIAADIRAGAPSALRIIAMPRIAQPVAAPAVARLMQRDSKVRVRLDVRARREASNWLAGRGYDLGVGMLPIDHPDIECSTLLLVRAQAILPKHHPLATRPYLTAEDLKGQPIIRLLEGLFLRDQLDDIFHSAGVEPNEVCAVASSPLACSLVANGVGITICDELVASHVPISGISLVPIEPARWMSVGIFLPKVRQASSARDEYITILRDLAQDLSSRSKGIRLPRNKS